MHSMIILCMLYTNKCTHVRIHVYSYYVRIVLASLLGVLLARMHNIL